MDSKEKKEESVDSHTDDKMKNRKRSLNAYFIFIIERRAELKETAPLKST